MSDPCVVLQDLLRSPDAGEEDPRWIHVRGCPRCRGLLAAHRRFAALPREGASAGDAHAAERIREENAVARLHATLHREILGAQPAPFAVPSRPPIRGFGESGEEIARARRPSTDQVNERAASERHPSRRLLGGGLRSFLARPRLAIPLLGAASLIAGVFLLLRDSVPWRAGDTVIREEVVPGAGRPVVVFPARKLPDGTIALQWRAFPAADAYRVRLLDAGLLEVACVEAGPETTLVIPAPTAGPASGPAVYWQADALERADRLANSVPQPLP